MTEVPKLTASDGVALDWFGYSVAIDGDTIVISGDTVVARAGFDDISSA